MRSERWNSNCIVLTFHFVIKLDVISYTLLLVSTFICKEPCLNFPWNIFGWWYNFLRITILLFFSFLLSFPISRDNNQTFISFIKNFLSSFFFIILSLYYVYIFLYYDYMLIEIFKNLKSQHSTISRIFNFLKLKTIFLKLLHLYR